MTDQPSPSLEGACHCGAVRLKLPAAPEKATDCNCSICRRLAGLWVYYEVGTVAIEGHPEHTAEYIWGDKTLRTLRCAHCGVATHWEPLAPKPGDKHGVNLRNFDPRLVASVPVHRFGAGKIPSPFGLLGPIILRRPALRLSHAFPTADETLQRRQAILGGLVRGMQHVLVGSDEGEDGGGEQAGGQT